MKHATEIRKITLNSSEEFKKRMDYIEKLIIEKAEQGLFAVQIHDISELIIHICCHELILNGYTAQIINQGTILRIDWVGNR